MRKVSAKQIDNLVRSVKMGKNKVGQKMVARFDKLAFVTTCKPEYLEHIYKSLKKVVTNDVFQVKHSTPTGDMGELYSSAICIKNKKNHRQYVVIHYNPREKRGEFRFELSPQHFRKKALNTLFMWLGNESLLGEYLFELLKSAWVTRIDYALDTYELNIDDYFIHLKSASKGEVSENSDGGYGINLGSRTSEIYASIYPKYDAGKDVSDVVEEVDEFDNVLVDVEQYPKFLRIELRYQPKKQKLLLSKINNMPNLLEKVIFIDTKVISELSDLVPDYQKLTLPQIRAYIKEVHPSKVLKKFDRLLQKNRVELIDHEQVWGKLYILKYKLGILGNDALWQKNLREKWAKKHGYK
ncbi:TPA: hypothetical protein RG734_000654 [Providencia stuartii]|nr:hypothetical protein [Providencia stuartii]